MNADAWGHVCSFLDIQSLVLLSAVSSALRKVAQENARPHVVLVQTIPEWEAYKAAWAQHRYVNTSGAWGHALAKALLGCVPALERRLTAHLRMQLAQSPENGRPVVIPPDVWAQAEAEGARRAEEVRETERRLHQCMDHAQAVFDLEPEVNMLEYFCQGNMQDTADADVDHYLRKMHRQHTALEMHRRRAKALQGMLVKLRQ
tara:strand:+ start:683 stop:1291 length:609 start_codon:yes stop_codon:yes gene_type:complete